MAEYAASVPAGRTRSTLLTGPATTALRAVAASTASIIRCVGIAYIIMQLAIWHSFYAADVWRLAGPVAALVWGTTVVLYLPHRRPMWQLACIDSGAYIALAVVAEWCVPPAMRGDSSNWLYIVLVGQLVAPAWFAPTTVAAPLALASAAAYWAGAVLTPGVSSGDGSPAGATVLLLAVAAGAWCGRRLLYRRASEADLALERADLDSRAQYVALSRHTERREHERMLHDTVLNTLTALARAGRGDAREVARRCRRDVALMEHALSDPGDWADAAGQPYGGLLTGIEAVAAEMRAGGLNVHVDVTGGGRAGSGRGRDRRDRQDERDERTGRDERDMPIIPVPVAASVAHAVREALANVVSHARTGEAWVEVSLPAPDAEPARTADLQVTVRDAGVGFDPARVDPARLGLRRSVIERMADCGGQASVTSAPREGTVVSLRWNGPPDRGDGAIAGGIPGWGHGPW
jgi:signal transduction histidine kinase